LTLDDLEGLYCNRNSASSQATAGLSCYFYDTNRQTYCLTMIRHKRLNRGMHNMHNDGQKTSHNFQTDLWGGCPKFLDLIFKMQHISYHGAKYHGGWPSDLWHHVAKKPTVLQMGWKKGRVGKQRWWLCHLWPAWVDESNKQWQDWLMLHS